MSLWFFIMPYKLATPCKYPGCPNLTTEGYCVAHKKEGGGGYDDNRPSANARGYDYRWQKARLHFLRRHPLCAECQRAGRIEPSVVVDHIIPHRGDMTLFWDEDNWRALCKPCHDRCTALYDGAFGNPLREKAAE